MNLFNGAPQYLMMGIPAKILEIREGVQWITGGEAA